ncbi:MAG: hypothetical protein EOO26_10460, partial [Comamonadaceae bacterium]
PASVDSLPTSANQEDHVSMATFGARRLGDMVDNTAVVVGIEAMCAAQGIELKRVPPSVHSEPLPQSVHAEPVEARREASTSSARTDGEASTSSARTGGALRSSPLVEAEFAKIRTRIAYLERDRYLAPDIEAMRLWALAADLPAAATHFLPSHLQGATP